MKKYRKYDDKIIEMVVASGNPNLFPHLKIPRTTAMYWINSSKKKVKIKETPYDDALLEKIKKLEEELKKERMKILFLSTFIRNLFGFTKLLSHQKNKEVVVNQVLEFSKWFNKNELFRLINIQPNRFFRYKVETKGCERIGLKKCKILSPNQLTFLEQSKIYDLCNDKRLKHLSVKGLQLHAWRNKILTCSYDSWRKYVGQFRGNLKVEKKKKYRVGIRASKVNEIWHMDITEFKSKEGGKIYLQVLMDNFSRKVIHWEISRNKNEILSLKTFRKATTRYQPNNILTDGGGENIGSDIKKLFSGRGIASLIAKKDIRFSNSMIESFFRTLKNSYLNKFKHYKISKLFNSVRRAVNSYNESPLSSIDGARPNELFAGIVLRSSLKSQLQECISESRSIRPLINKTCSGGTLL